MQNVQTLTEFLRSTDASFRLFDMGRRITKLSADAFLKFENHAKPYPLPFLHHAWIGVLLWNPKASDQHLVWFLKLPLDEQGFLVQAARDDFLHRLARSVGNQLLQQGGDEDPLKDNPFAFTPDQEKMAAFHARATRTLKMPASQYYEPAREYFSGKNGYDDWTGLGLQGIADICARLDERGNDRLLADALPKLPLAPLEALGAALENDPLPHGLTEALLQCLTWQLGDARSTPNLIGALLRGLSQGRPESRLHDALLKVLETDMAREPEVIAAIASRCWPALEDTGVRTRFLDALAENNAGQACFDRVIADLVFVPGMRAPIMESFRDPERSDALGRAIGAFFSGAQR